MTPTPARSWTLGCLCLLLLSATGCPPRGGPDAGTDAGDGDGGVIDPDPGRDAGVDAGPPPCRCNDDSNCDSEDEADYCYRYGIQCRCVAEATDAGFEGVCRRRHGVCDTCTSDEECGVSGVFDPPGLCKQLPGDSSGLKYCFQQ